MWLAKFIPCKCREGTTGDGQGDGVAALLGDGCWVESYREEISAAISQQTYIVKKTILPLSHQLFSRLVELFPHDGLIIKYWKSRKNQIKISTIYPNVITTT
jgi:hypothetical protein